MRKLLYWILFPLAAVSVGAFWPIHDAIAELQIDCKEQVCTMSRQELVAMRDFINQLLDVNRELRDQAAYERHRTHPVCNNS